MFQQGFCVHIIFGFLKPELKVKTVITVIIALSLSVSVASAKVTFKAHPPEPEMELRVGAQKGVTTVVHDVAATDVGTGTPVEGTPGLIVIKASVRGTDALGGSYTGFIITVDSSIPLSNGIDQIPFTEISWTSLSGEIPSGRFDGTSGQVILPPTMKNIVNDKHTYSYGNTQLKTHGTYTGSVAYTLSIP